MDVSKCEKRVEEGLTGVVHIGVGGGYFDCYGLPERRQVIAFRFRVDKVIPI